MGGTEMHKETEIHMCVLEDEEVVSYKWYMHAHRDLLVITNPNRQTTTLQRGT
jgi:hypothetical protein